MRNGRLEQLGTPDAIYHRPRTRYVADFIGETNLLAGKVLGANGGRVTIEVGGATLRAIAGGTAPSAGADVWLSVRPERLAVGPRGDAAPDRNQLDGVVTDVVFMGAGTRVFVTLADATRAVAHRPAGDAPAPGTPVAIGWPVEAGVLLRE
jgi:ABC-type Fe3+/spermidine/putrescine transport system ATPase subunit